MMDFVAVIMAGGQGQRFWPLSTADRPKQFLDLERRGRTLIQSTFDRLLPITGSVDKILVATGQRYAELVREQLPTLPAGNLLIEPEGRDSAPAIALASLVIEQQYGNVVAGFFSSDHSIGSDQTFAATVRAASQVAKTQQGLVTIGIRPTRPATSYGYIQQGQVVDGGNKVARFVEKPNAHAAESYLNTGKYLWNAGIFIWPTKTVLEELELHAPELLQPLRSGLMQGDVDAAFRTLPKISIDYALMEKSDRVYVVPGDFEWDDIGDWVALERHAANSTGDANTVQGRHYGHDATGNIIYTDGPDDTIITLGVKDMVVVKRGNTVLLLPKSRVQDIKELLADERVAALDLETA